MSEQVESEKINSDLSPKNKKDQEQPQEEEFKMQKPPKNIFTMNLEEVDSESKGSLMHEQYHHAG